MIPVGLTGGIACGKSAVARMLRARGVPVIDADQVSRRVVAPGEPALEAIAERFGAGVLQADGSLDRAALGAIVFADPAARRALEAITHPAIRARVARWLQDRAAAGEAAAVVEAALLVEGGGYRLYPELIVVTCDPATQLARLQARDGFDAAAARQRLEAQLPAAEKARHATEHIVNDGSLADLEQAVEAAWGRILARGGVAPAPQ